MTRLFIFVIIVFLLVYGLFWVLGKALANLPLKLIIIIFLAGFSFGVVSVATIYYVWFL